MSSKAKITLKRHKKLKKIWHPESGLVIKSAKEKVVVGRIEDDEYIELDDKALELCEEYNFKVDPSLVEDEEDEVSASEDESPKKSSRKKSSRKKSSKKESPRKSKKSKPKDDSDEDDSDDDDEEETKKDSESKAKEDHLALLATMMKRHNRELQELVMGVTVEAGDSEREAELEAELKETKAALEKSQKDLAKTKKKLKALLDLE